jgi:type IV pilus modification protein PilV
MKRMNGFTLFESLVALVVLSVGLLGATALLLGGLRDQGLALRHFAATTLVTDMADRIRASSARPLDADLEAFATAARAQFPFHATETRVTFAPATGPATPAEYRITLRWHEPGDGDTSVEITTLVLAQMPVAG